MKKRVFACLLAAAMLIVPLASCKSNGGDPVDSATETTGTETPSTTAPSTTEPAATEPATTEPATTDVELPPLDPPPSTEAPTGASVYSGNPDTSWYTGDKAEYTLTTADQLAGLNILRNQSKGETTFEGVTIKLGTDMIFNEGTTAEVLERGILNKRWQVPSHSKYLFKGVLDGQGHTVSGVFFNLTDSGISGMFGSLSGNAEIKNLNVVNSCMISAPVANKQILGCLACRVAENGDNVTITNVNVNFAVQENGYAVNIIGGFVGQVVANATLTMKDCTFNGTIDITGEAAGGMIGYVSNTNATVNLENCTVKGGIRANKDAGGLIGSCTAKNLTVKNCTNEAKIVAKSYAGGLFGACVTDALTESNAKNSGEIFATSFAGDIAGFRSILTDPTNGARPATPEGMTSLRVMSFNVRLNLPQDYAQNRIAAVKTEILSHDPDLLGLQEDTGAWNTGLILEDYNIILGNYLNADTERTAIYYKKGLPLLEGGNVWLTASGKQSGAALTVADLTQEGGKYQLSEKHLEMLGITKDSPDSILKDRSYSYVDAQTGKQMSYESGYVMLDTRNTVYGVFDINGQKVIYLNTHLQHRGQDSEYSNDALQALRSMERVKEFDYMAKKIEELKTRYPDALVFMTGDWNDLPMTDIYNSIVNDYGYICANFTAKERYGYHCSWNNAFNGDKHGHNYPSNSEGTGSTYLDYLFLEEGIQPLKFTTGKGKATIKDSKTGEDLTIYTSDHLSIVGDIAFKTPRTGSPIDPNYKPSTPTDASYYNGSPDTSWFDINNPQKEYTLTTANQLWGLIKIRQDNKGAVTFEGITIKLGTDMVFNTGDLSQGCQYSWIELHSKYIFKGTLDGQGHTVSGIYLTSPDSGYKGILGTVGGNAVIKNITFDNTYLLAPTNKDKTQTKDNVGMLMCQVASDANVTVSNVHIKATIQENDINIRQIGGFAGQVASSGTLTMTDCSFEGKLVFATKGTYVGGLVGKLQSGATLNATNCKVSADISAIDYCGGLVGHIVSNAKFNNTNSTSEGTITSNGTNKGDLIGKDERA